ncbi:LPO_1073/Vpar_1526 family protein, partial [candidate division KSB1 bacterium]
LELRINAMNSLSKIIGLDNVADNLIDLAIQNSPKAKDQAFKNLVNYTGHLEQRVSLLEMELPIVKNNSLSEAFSNPANMKFLGKCLNEACLTSDDDRHSILASLLLERLNSNENDMVALVGSAACEVVNSLTEVHFRILATALILHRKIIPKYEGKATKEIFSEHIDDIFRKYEKLLSKEIIVMDIDFGHLWALSCLMHLGMRRKLYEVYYSSLHLDGWGHKDATPSKHEWWNNLELIWSRGLTYSILSATGTLIGIFYLDHLFDEKSEIHWSR